MASESFGTSSGYSTSTPSVIQSPQSEWGLDLSQMLAALGQNQYKWAQTQFNNGMAFTADNINRYLATAGQASDLATNLLGRYKDTFEPIMNKFIEQAGSYNSEARQRFNMGQAESTVSQAMNAGADEAERKLQSFGIDPSSGRYQDQILASRIQRAAAMAGAGTQASVNTSAIGRNMTQQAAQMGQNVPGMTVNALGAGVNALTGAQGAMQGMLQTGAALTSSAAPFFNAAGAANHLPATGNNSKSKQGSGNQSMTTDPGQSGAGKGSGSPAQQSGGQQGPGPSKGGQLPAADANRQVGNLAMRQPDSKSTNGLDQLGEIAPWQTDQDKEGNPIYDPSAWDYATKDQGQTPFNAPSWMTNDTLATGEDLANGGSGRPSPSFDDFQGLGDQGNVFNGRQMGDSVNDPSMPSDWASPQTRNQEIPFYDPSTPSVDPSNPWAGVGNPLSDSDGGGDGGGGGQDFSQFGQQDYGQQDFGQQDFGQQDQGYQQDDYANYDDYDNQQSSGSSQDYSGGGGYGDYGGGYAQGGKVRGRGVLPQMSPSRGRKTDDVPARLNVGEFVMPKDVVAHKGSEFFTNLIKKSRMARTGQAGPAPKPKMKPALRMRPTFVSNRV